MNRNQKIALGCGGAGCLGLIVVVIAGLLIYFFAYNSSSNRNYNFNRSTNRNSNTNDNSDLSTNANDNSSESSDSSDSSDSSSTSASSLSEDDKHKLYQAAAMTGDTELVRRVSVKLGLIDEDFTPRDNYQAFLTAHIEWVMRNTDFIRSISDAEKARAYVNENLPT